MELIEHGDKRFAAWVATWLAARDFGDLLFERGNIVLVAVCLFGLIGPFCALFVQALDAMQYAHGFKYRWEGEERVGIVHRDIKPANLLVHDPETIKVSDFGIVKVQQRNPAVTQKLTPGTSAYMSPEAILGPQQFGLPELDARSDI